MLRAQVMNDLIGVDAGVNRRIDLQDEAVLADHVSYAAVKPENRNAIVGAIGARDAAVGIEQQRERQAVFPDERLVRVSRINTASEHRNARGLEARVAVAKRTRLPGASGRAV